MKLFRLMSVLRLLLLIAFLAWGSVATTTFAQPANPGVILRDEEEDDDDDDDDEEDDEDDEDDDEEDDDDDDRN